MPAINEPAETLEKINDRLAAARSELSRLKASAPIRAKRGAQYLAAEAEVKRIESQMNAAAPYSAARTNLTKELAAARANLPKVASEAAAKDASVATAQSAVEALEAKAEIAKAAPQQEDDSSSGDTQPASGGAGKTVHVKGYTRKDGAYVSPHSRSAPRSGGGSRSGRR